MTTVLETNPYLVDLPGDLERALRAALSRQPWQSPVDLITTALYIYCALVDDFDGTIAQLEA
jgi:hypothetical protein